MRLSFFQEVLLAAAAGLAVVLLVEAWVVLPEPALAEGSMITETPPPTTALNTEDVLSFTLPPRESLRHFIERPLFERTRRGAADIYAPKDTGDDVTLIGIIFTPEERVALLRAQGATDPIRARTGDAVGAWRVAEITQNSVLLRSNDSVKWVTLP